MAGDNQMDGKNLPSLLDPIVEARRIIPKATG